MCNILNWRVVDWKGQTFRPQGKYLVHTVYFWPLSVQEHSEAIRWTSNFSDFRQPYISKTAGPRAERTKCELHGQVLSKYRALWSSSVQCHSEAIRSIFYFSDFWQSCVANTAGRRAKQTKIWALGASSWCMQDSYDIYMFRWLFGAFRFSETFYLENGLS